MTRKPWATTPTHPPAANPLRNAGLLAVAVCLLAGATGLLSAASPPADAGEELGRLAQALRQKPTLEAYKALAHFATEYAESELSAQASFALGLADFDAGRWGEARDRFLAARRSRAVGDYAALYLARAQIQQGALEAARAPLQELFTAGEPLQEAARVLEAERRVRAGQAAAAVEWLRRQPGLDERPALLLALGQAQRAAGDPLAAAETWQRIYFEFPLSPEAEPSNQRLEELRTDELKGNYPAASETRRRTRADKLWELQAYRGARSAYVDLSVRAGEPARAEARQRAAETLYLLGAPEQACEELKRVSRTTPEFEAELRAFRVRCALRAGDYARVETELAALAPQGAERASQPPPSKWYAEALLTAGNTALARSDAARARDFFQRLVEVFPAGEAASEAHWKLSWLAYQEGEAAASRLLEEHLKRFPESSFLPRALYWRARAADAEGAAAVARRLLGLLLELAPRDYLAQQAESRRSGGGPAGDEGRFPAWLESLSLGLQNLASSPERWSVPPAPAQQQLEKAEALARLGFAELAGEVLEAGLRRWSHPAFTLAQARLAYAQEKYARATEILRRANPNYWRYRLDELPREAWEILFPRPYWEVIEREAERQQLDPYLVAALIRQESRFERAAVSSAGALGLMQLMPATARRMANAPRLPASRLHDPALNIRLGTRFLAELLRRFDGSLEKAVAGYNAGGTRVEGWASQIGYREPAEFVESIPVTQTREFVYTVLRNYRFYHDLYAAQDARAQSADGSVATPDPDR